MNRRANSRVRTREHPEMSGTETERTAPKALSEQQAKDLVDQLNQAGCLPSPADLGIDFDDAWYMTANRDVADAVASGGFASGFLHYVKHGRKEGRSPSPRASVGGLPLTLPPTPLRAGALTEGSLDEVAQRHSQDLPELHVQRTPESLESQTAPCSTERVQQSQQPWQPGSGGKRRPTWTPGSPVRWLMTTMFG